MKFSLLIPPKRLVFFSSTLASKDWCFSWLLLVLWNYVGFLFFLVLVRELEINQIVSVLILFWAFFG